jgi:outer membrane protein insertion porin family
MLSCKFQPIFIIFFICVFALVTTAQKQERLVEALDIQGNRRLKDVDLIEHIKTRPGDLFDEKQVKEDLKSLQALGLFNKKNTSFLIEKGVRGGVNVIFEVQELPLIAEVDFGCLRFVSKDELISELRAQNVKIESGEVYNFENLQSARRIIQEFLEKRGFSESKVEIYEESVSATTVKIGFHIKEMPVEDDDCSCCEN